MSTLRPEDYHVGWVSALPKELTAARIMRDKEYKHSWSQSPQDHNSYVFGQIHGHNVVMACLPAGMYGKVFAAIVVNNMLRTFTNIRFILMVGIGGGIPDLENGVDIRLGDVVVSQPSGTSSGVVQHDLGKNLGDKSFERIGILPGPPPFLLTALSSLQSDHSISANIMSSISTRIQSGSQLAEKGYLYPGSENDQLYCSHSDSHDPQCQNGVVIRKPRKVLNPEVHYGIIASGDMLMRNAVERDRLGRELGAMCIEMEAAGLMNAGKCIVIRGICDYADSHKNDIWQEYAAVTAASFARELLSTVSPVTVDRRSASLREIDEAISNYYRTSQCLEIKRLSGENLEIGRCYINLSIIDHVPDKDKKLSYQAATDRNRSPFSRDARLKVETPPANRQLTLESLFNPRESSDGTIARPSRILIWGRAGIGKSTLCKKIVYDWIHNGLWNDLFDRVYWLPLRRLKHIDAATTNIGQLVQKELYAMAREPHAVAEVLQNALVENSSRTLFILDGLDEVSYVYDSDTSMGRLLDQLLTRKNIILTSRPHNTYAVKRKIFDLELETIGFLPAQVEEYLQKEQQEAPEKNVAAIRQFIRDHPLVLSLVRIPVQLDAMCYCWDSNAFQLDDVTMTMLYQGIEQKMWERYILQSGKKKDGELLTLLQIQDSNTYMDFVKDERRFLEKLAFDGLYNEIAEFDAEFIRKAITGGDYIGNDRIDRMSFIRSSDSSIAVAARSRHFIHLTFQEYFGARYFVQRWISDTSISLLGVNTRSPHAIRTIELSTPGEFLSQRKYSDRYDIFWRFVVGLLHDHSEPQHLARFFDKLGDETRDLIGPAHQRLIIHCLGEIHSPHSELQSRIRVLEAEYWNWIQFEFNINSSTQLMQEAECPDRIFLPWLRGSDEEKIRVMSALKQRPNVSSRILQEIMSELDTLTNMDVFGAAFEVLGNHCDQITGDQFPDVIAMQSIRSRLTAATALSKSSRLGKAAVDALTQLLENKEASVQVSAADALSHQRSLPERAVAALIQLLKHKESSVQQSAANALKWQISLSETTVAKLVQLLQDNETDVRWNAAHALSQQTSLPEAAVTKLVQLLQDKKATVQWSASDTLSWQPCLSETTVAKLVQLLQDNETDVQWKAINALCQQTSLLKTAMTKLVQLLQDSNARVRWSAADALGQQTSLPKTAMAKLVQLLQDNDADIRWSAADVLGRQTSLPKTTVAKLVQLLQDNNARVRWSAADALGQQTSLPETAVAKLVQLLQDNDSHIQCRVVSALSRHVSLPKTAVTKLIQLLQNNDADIRWSAADILGQQTSLPKTAMAKLVQLLQDNNARVRWSATDALGQQISLSETTVVKLVQLLQDSNARVRWSAADALGQQISLPKTAIAKLVQLLQDNEADVRRSAAKALSRQTALPEAALLTAIALPVESLISAREIFLGDQRRIDWLIQRLSRSNLRTLLMLWLRWSFEEFVTCCLQDNTLSIFINGESWSTVLQDYQLRVFKHLQDATRKSIGDPHHYFRQIRKSQQ